MPRAHSSANPFHLRWLSFGCLAQRSCFSPLAVALGRQLGTWYRCHGAHRGGWRKLRWPYYGNDQNSSPCVRSLPLRGNVDGPNELAWWKVDFRPRYRPHNISQGLKDDTSPSSAPLSKNPPPEKCRSSPGIARTTKNDCPCHKPACRRYEHEPPSDWRADKENIGRQNFLPDGWPCSPYPSSEVTQSFTSWSASRMVSVRTSTRKNFSAISSSIFAVELTSVAVDDFNAPSRANTLSDM